MYLKADESLGFGTAAIDRLATLHSVDEVSAKEVYSTYIIIIPDYCKAIITPLESSLF